MPEREKLNMVDYGSLALNAQCKHSAFSNAVLKTVKQTLSQ